MAVKIAAIGLGNRTSKYLQYVRNHPDRVVLVAAVDPDPERLSAVAMQFSLPEDRCFLDADAFFTTACGDADAVIIGSPDHTHFPFALKAIAHGCHILLEKPIGVSDSECRELVSRAAEAGVMVSTCYVLRYNAYFEKLKELSMDPRLGRAVSLEHTINVGIDRTTHSYVRGPWNTKEMDCTMFLSKCCHDVDIALWLLGERAVKVISHGNSRLFVPDNAPGGSADRCIGCPVERNCPYSAVDLYLRRRDWTDGFIPSDGETKDDAIMRELREGRYGRCAFKCYNDAINHQSVFFEMESGATATINMESITNEDNRVTVIRFSGGVISGDEKSIRVHYFGSNEDKCFDFSNLYHQPFHGNADLKLVDCFISAIEGSNPERIRTSPEESLMSHLICFAAEESRQSGKRVEIL